MKSLIDKLAVLTGKGRYHQPDNAPEWWHPYFQSRPYHSRKKLCYAPFNSMYFNVHGEVSPCELTLNGSEKYPEKSIKEIWMSDKFVALRKKIAEYQFPEACKVCKHNLEQGNFKSVLSKLYDQPYPLTEYPSIMEFELSNRCNLECVMCKGDLSSSIRKNSEHLPPLQMKYGDQFTKELEEFIPHLKHAKFVGGEPFLIDIYYDIWEKIIAINPEMEITITTNATVYNQKVERILNKLNCNIIVSIDSLEKENFENIRKNSKFERVLENLDKFYQYTSTSKKYFGVSFNPMRRNMHEIVGFTTFCNEKKYPLWFNTVHYPFKESLITLDDFSLQNLHQELQSAHFISNSNISKENIARFNNFKDNQLYPWYLKAKADREAKEKSVQSGNFSKDDLVSNIENYLNQDHYLTVFQRDKIWNDWKKSLENIQDNDILQKLYLMTPQDCLEKINEFCQHQN